MASDTTLGASLRRSHLAPAHPAVIVLPVQPGPKSAAQVAYEARCARREAARRAEEHRAARSCPDYRGFREYTSGAPSKRAAKHATSYTYIITGAARMDGVTVGRKKA